jgi:diketogulonate reductase-like aldo/keto reductase
VSAPQPGSLTIERERMEYVRVQGVEIPALGLGTWRLTGSRCRQAVEEALAIGYRHLDTAQMYGNEHEVGAAITASSLRADELFLTTKIANENHAPDAVRASTEASLRNLGVEAIDLLLIHQPVDLDILETTLEAMAALQDEGLVHHLGVSNFSVELLERSLRAVNLLAIQIEYHPLRSQHDQLEAAQHHDLLLQAYSPLARSAVVANEDIGDIARRVGATPTQVTLRWLMNQPNVAAIPKASSHQHLIDNWGALRVELDDQALRRLDALTRQEREAAEVGV